MITPFDILELFEDKYVVVSLSTLLCCC